MLEGMFATPDEEAKGQVSYTLNNVNTKTEAAKNANVI
jgi:hypothetical protein